MAGYQKAEQDQGGTQAQGDYQLALILIRKAADQGYAPAEDLLAVAYINGNGVGSDQNKAAQLDQAAALQGFPLAEFMLGIDYTLGHGVTADQDKSTALIAEAHAAGYTGQLAF